MWGARVDKAVAMAALIVLHQRMSSWVVLLRRQALGAAMRTGGKRP